MKYKILILFFLNVIFLTKSYAQNLVPNSDFETYIECPDTSFIGFHAILDSTWYQFSSADYFNTCDTSNYYGVPQNFIGGYQFALSGDGYTGLIAYNPLAFSRENIGVKLISPLITGQLYYVRFYVSLPDDHQYAIENMGALFTDTLYNPVSSGTWVTGIPQVENSGNILSDKFNWMEVAGSFVANGGEQYLTIGNFRGDTNTVSQFLGSTSGSQSAYYYIDDVYVGTTQPPLSIFENANEEINYKLYPNPGSGILTFEYKMKQEDKAEVKFYDVTGKLIEKYSLDPGKDKIQLNTSLNNGIYFYEIIVNGRMVKSDKVVIIN